MKKKSSSSTRQGIYKPMARARVTNGKELLPDVDHRSLWVRRFRDVMALHVAALGGEEAISESEKALVRRAACIVVELEQMEQKFAANGEATVAQLEAYQRASNSLRRLLEVIGSQTASEGCHPPPSASVPGEIRADRWPRNEDAASSPDR